MFGSASRCRHVQAPKARDTFVGQVLAEALLHPSQPAGTIQTVGPLIAIRDAGQQRQAAGAKPDKNGQTSTARMQWPTSERAWRLHMVRTSRAARAPADRIPAPARLTITLTVNGIEKQL